MTADDPAWAKSDAKSRASSWRPSSGCIPISTPTTCWLFALSRVRHVFAFQRSITAAASASIETSVPGLFLVNSAQIVNGTLNVNETVRLAESSLATLSQPLSDGSARRRSAANRRRLVAEPPL